jgi:hypothetical protein
MRVVFNKDEKELLVNNMEDIVNQPYYLGAYFIGYGYDAKYLIVRAADKWRIVCPVRANDKSINCAYNEESLVDLLNRVRSQHNTVEIHAFETLTELYMWLHG